MSNENELRFGHRVITHSMEKKSSYKGRFISKEQDEFWVLHDGDNDPQRMSYCELDLDTTEFLPGDVVEYQLYSDLEDGAWNIGQYSHKKINENHVVNKNGLSYVAHSVRYPQTEPTLKERLDKAIEGGARCILMNPSAMGFLLSTFTVDNRAYKNIPIAVTDTVKTFEVIK